MKIGYSATIWDDATSGIGTYIAEHLALLAQRSDLRVSAIEYGGRVLPAGISPTRSGTGSGTRLGWTPLSDIAWHRRGLVRLARAERFDLVHVPTVRRLPARLACPTTVTVHDLGPIRLAGKYGHVRGVYHRLVIPRWLRSIGAIVTPSAATKADIVEFYGVEPGRITVVANGVDHAHYHPGDPAESAELLARVYGLAQPFFVYVSRLEHPAKNHVRLIEAFRRWRERSRQPHRLVLVGASWNGHEVIRRAASDLVEAGAVLFAGRVPREHLPHFYRGAQAAIYPSLFEGFGLPVIEAMACATPVACSRSSSLTEIAEGRGLLFDPLEIDDIAAAMSSLAHDAGERARLRALGLAHAQGFTWRRSVDETIAVWRQAMDRA